MIIGNNRGSSKRFDMAIIKKSHDQTVHFVHIVQKYRNGQMDEMDKMDTTKK